MSEIYELLKEKTKGKVENGKQVMIAAHELLDELSQNEPTIYANLRRLSKRPEVKYKTFKVVRFKEGRKVTFKKTWFYIDYNNEVNKNGNNSPT